MRLALGMVLTFYTIVAKGLKLKVRMFRELISTFVVVTGEKLVEEMMITLISINIGNNIPSFQRN